ncbi:LysM peptidoglycan-binding domain-containing protein [Methyloligella solikamskensis]|uniref:LysM peptidoglycan-binding domain-containing protein n=1 Tax=Methyloligella solikamskensis TaxID=1177756 RepID=A0ABW3J9U9_9HYPH
MGNKVVGIIVTVAFFVLVALVGYRLYHEQSESQEAAAPPATEQGEQAKAPEPEDKTGEETAADTDAAQEEDASGQDETAKSSSEGGTAGEDKTAGEEPLADEGEKTAGEPADIPSFDVVRIEPSGEGVIAGRAEPGWGVEIQSNGTGIADTKADPAGQWSLVLDEPLGEGEHSLSIVATSPDGEKSLTSQQKVLVSMGDEEGEKTVVALREPGKATQILQEQAAGEGSDAAASDTSEDETGGESESGQQMAAADTDKSGSSAGEDAASSDDDASAASDESEDASAPAGDTASDGAGDEAASSDTVEAKKAGEDSSGLPEPPVRIKTVDYEDRGEDSGKIIVTGTSTKPSTDILLYLDGELIGESRTDSDGRWKIEATKYLAPGNRALQVDLVNRSDDVILGRAAVGMRRQTPPPVAQEVAEADSETSGKPSEADSGSSDAGSAASSNQEKTAETDRVAGDRATSGASDMSAPPEEESTADASDFSAPAEDQSTAGGSDMSASSEEQSTADAGDVPDPDRAPGEEMPDPDRAPGDMASVEAESQPESTDSESPKVYTVRRGDTLWAIAEEYFGGGWRYTMIFKDNRGKIRNPHWIYPDQEFEIRKQ